MSNIERRYWMIDFTMADILRDLFLGFVRVHILYHPSQESAYGTWLIEELGEHGYTLSRGTLYPILHGLEEAKLQSSCEEVINDRGSESITRPPRLVEESSKRLKGKSELILR